MSNAKDKLPNLLIVESPTKAKSLSSYLDRGWAVVATKGHIKDLPSSEFGIDIHNQFEPSYVWLKGKKSLFLGIQKLAKESKEIFIASDPDREGEIIAKHIYDELIKFKKPIYRIRLKEISKEELFKQLNNKSGIREADVESQIARRLVDRIFGYRISPDLWKFLKNPNLSAGRVQSTVLSWICEREQKILNFVTEIYYILKLQGFVNSEAYELTHTKHKLSEEEINKILLNIGFNGKNSDVRLNLISIKDKKIKKNPPPPFTTASLQEMASKTLGFNSKKTMRTAQNLFEGKSIYGGERKGLITYMRTDSTRVSDSKKYLGIEFLKSKYGDLISNSYSPKKTKKNVQDAHEAVIPVDVNLTPDQIKVSLTTDEFKLYQLIWERFLTSLLNPELGIETNYQFEKNGELFELKFEETIEFGYKNFPKPKEIIKKNKPLLNLGDEYLLTEVIKEEKETTCPERYTEGKIIKMMEEKGVGRPSTYSQTLETLKTRKYILEQKKKLSPTSLGLRVNEFLILNYKSLIGEIFTKELEEKLDSICESKATKLDVLTSFYETLTNLMKNNRIFKNDKYTDKKMNPNTVGVQSKISKEEKNSFKETKMILTDSIESYDINLCPKCKIGSLKTKLAKNGKTIFFCSKYPHCDYITYESKRK